jgi:cytochrome c-type biogenesis protein CcmH/NrfF
MNPPVSADTFVLWFGPVILVLLGAGVIGVTIMRARKRLTAEPGPEDLDLPA